jgi:cyd operon protein YbgT
MWYFTWILGLLLACSLGIINVLRLEAQEAWDKEHIPVDALTQLITRDAMLVRLREKIENTRRSGFPFSLVFISLTEFKNKHNLRPHEMDSTLRSVVDCLKEDIRNGLDIAARMDEQDFVIAMPGAPLHRAEQVALKVKNDIFAKVRAPIDLAVEINVGVAEYSEHAVEFGQEIETIEHEVNELLRIAMAKSSN